VLLAEHPCSNFGAGRESEFGEDAADVGLDGTFGQNEVLGDVAVGSRLG
jgi:hypothetical protein